LLRWWYAVRTLIRLVVDAEHFDLHEASLHSSLR
jgi:hypothetical protein